MIVTLKLWDDEAGVWNNDVAAAYGVDLGDMNDMERLFLKHLEYSLFLTPEQVFLFAVDCKFARLQNTKDNSPSSSSPSIKEETTESGRKRKIDGCAPLDNSFLFRAACKQQKC